MTSTKKFRTVVTAAAIATMASTAMVPAVYAACNPCSASACGACNPCAASACGACNPCNPCAASACNPCNPCNPCTPCEAN